MLNLSRLTLVVLAAAALVQNAGAVRGDDKTPETDKGGLLQPIDYNAKPVPLTDPKSTADLLQEMNRPLEGMESPFPATSDATNLRPDPPTASDLALDKKFTPRMDYPRAVPLSPLHATQLIDPKDPFKKPVPPGLSPENIAALNALPYHPLRFVAESDVTSNLPRVVEPNGRQYLSDVNANPVPNQPPPASGFPRVGPIGNPFTTPDQQAQMNRVAENIAISQVPAIQDASKIPVIGMPLGARNFDGQPAVEGDFSYPGFVPNPNRHQNSGLAPEQRSFMSDPTPFVLYPDTSPQSPIYAPNLTPYAPQLAGSATTPNLGAVAGRPQVGSMGGAAAAAPSMFSKMTGGLFGRFMSARNDSPVGQRLRRRLMRRQQPQLDASQESSLLEVSAGAQTQAQASRNNGDFTTVARSKDPRRSNSAFEDRGPYGYYYNHQPGAPYLPPQKPQISSQAFAPQVPITYSVENKDNYQKTDLPRFFSDPRLPYLAGQVDAADSKVIEPPGDAVASEFVLPEGIQARNRRMPEPPMFANGVAVGSKDDFPAYFPPPPPAPASGSDPAAAEMKFRSVRDSSFDSSTEVWRSAFYPSKNSKQDSGPHYPSVNFNDNDV